MVFLRELWAFLRIRKRLWLLPLIVMILVLGGLIILAESSSISTFFYTVF